MKLQKRVTLMFTAMLLAVILSVPATAAVVCKIGNKGYSSLSEAVSKVKNGQTIKVTKAIRTSKHVEMPGKKFTIDFAGKKYTFTNTKEWAFGIAPGNTVTIKNLNLEASSAFFIGGTLNLVSGKMSSGYIQVNNDDASRGTLNIKGGTYNIKKAGDEGPWIENYGTVKITKGTFKGAADMRNQFKMTISGGKFIYSGGHDILANNSGQVTITGGSFNSGDYTTINNFNKGKLAIKGGTFTAKENYVIHSAEKSTLAISGGTFVRKVQTGPVIYSSSTAKISGGTFKGGLVFAGKAAVTGGKSTHRIVAEGGGIVTVKNFTVNQGKTPPGGPGYGDAALIALKGGKITVKGGTYISKNGVGYAAAEGGKIVFGVKNYQQLFKVKKLSYEE